ncbi:MAG: universal stress protein, partial [Verrucomicrobiota bacterium]
PELSARWVVLEVGVWADPAAAASIQQAAERFGAHLVCLGTHGRGGLAGTLLGSVAAEVVRGSRRPVLLVRSPGK